MSMTGYIDGQWHVITFEDHPNPVKSIQLQVMTVAPCGARLDHIPLLGAPGDVPTCAVCLKVFVPDGPKEWRPSLPPSSRVLPQLPAMTFLLQFLNEPFKKLVNSMLESWGGNVPAAEVHNASIALATKCRGMLDVPELRREILNFVRDRIGYALEVRPELAGLSGYSIVFKDASPVANDLPSIEITLKLPTGYTVLGRLALLVES